jgi:protein-L-isoaspartate(D-aspartate) O-methyltransferase
MVPAEVRRQYAAEILSAAKVTSENLLKAFAAVPREEFLGPPPWTLLSPPPSGQRQLQITDVSDARQLYRDIGVLLDPSRNLANGVPTTVAPWLEALNLSEGKSVFHLGCGTGYYSAVIAEAVGASGSVTAVEVDAVLAAQARANLARYPNVRVIEGDGAAVSLGPTDAILIHAGVTHPTESWLDNLKPAGSLVLPLTVEFGVPYVSKGMVLHVSKAPSGYAAHFLPAPVMIYLCSGGGRNSEFANLLSAPFMSGSFNSVKSLRRNGHSPEPTCWLHAPTFCLSTCALV